MSFLSCAEQERSIANYAKLYLNVVDAESMILIIGRKFFKGFT